jgi:hypothetical protein
MSITLPLKKMSAEEKIQVMESIWVDLCDTAGSTLSPDWHGKVLAGRNARRWPGKMRSLTGKAQSRRFMTIYSESRDTGICS